MKFGKIDYTNLLPFDTFLKKYITNSQTKKMIEHKKSYPSKINREFEKRRVDGAFISSIKSKNRECLNLGIVAKKDVLSVIAIINSEIKDDFESNTSNVLAKILNIKGEVLIGDKALKRYLLDNSDCVDLAKIWNDKFKLPFVFARFCLNCNRAKYDKISKAFLKQKIKIPQYILKQHSKKVGINSKDIIYYLSKISYKIEHKESRGLKLFLSKVFNN